MITPARLARLERIVKLVGPHPILLARTFAFLVARTTWRRRLRRDYERPLPDANVVLELPGISVGTIDQLPPQLHAAAYKLREEAEEILRHRVDILGSGRVDLGSDIDWHRDFKSGYAWPRTFYEDVEVTRLDDASDAKVPWELSRFHHLLTLARAASLFEDARYVAELESQLDSWLSANPPGIGINWVNPMEIGIRVANLAWIVATVEEFRPLSEGLRRSLIESLRWHGRHIAANLEGTPYLRSNHYLGDLLGLLVLGTFLRGEPLAEEWSRFARREFEREMMKQVHEDGVSFEGSVAYHGVAIEIFLVAAYVAAVGDRPLSGRYYDRLGLMAAVSRAVQHPNGRIPLFGDQDSGRILPEGFARPPTHENLMWLAAAVMTDTRPAGREAHAEVAWTFGLDAWKRVQEFPMTADPDSAAFPRGGLYVLRSEKTHVAVRCGDVGQNGSGGHSHNDLLSFELSFEGVPFVVDSGTYVYTSDVQTRNAFRSTSAHNTVAVDREEINPIDPAMVFELPAFARITIAEVDLAGATKTVFGRHDGYRRLTDPVVHARRFTLDAASGTVTVRDELLGTAEHDFESRLHFAPQTVLREIADFVYVAELDGVTATIRFAGLKKGELRVEDTWISDRFGVRSRGRVIIATARRVFPATVEYKLTPTP